jgi:hypothetical protein
MPGSSAIWLSAAASSAGSEISLVEQQAGKGTAGV